MQTHPSLRFQAHLAFPQGLPSVQKCQKSLQARPTPTLGQKDSAAKMKDDLTGKINNETLTKCICHKGFSGYSSVVARSNFRVGGQVTAPQSLTAHTLGR
jgi:hypothetical protein